MKATFKQLSSNLKSRLEHIDKPVVILHGFFLGRVIFARCDVGARPFAFALLHLAPLQPRTPFLHLGLKRIADRVASEDKTQRCPMDDGACRQGRQSDQLPHALLALR